MDSRESDPPAARLHRMLRSLPDRRAPAELEARVRAEIRRRESLPLWRRPYASWPAGLRGTFLVLCGAAVAALALGPSRLAGALERRLDWLAALQLLGAGLLETGRDIVLAIPAPLLGGAAFGFAVLAGAGALAYRLCARPKPRFSRHRPA